MTCSCTHVYLRTQVPVVIQQLMLDTWPFSPYHCDHQQLRDERRFSFFSFFYCYCTEALFWKYSVIFCRWWENGVVLEQKPVHTNMWREEKPSHNPYDESVSLTCFYNNIFNMICVFYLLRVCIVQYSTKYLAYDSFICTQDTRLWNRFFLSVTILNAG